MTVKALPPINSPRYPPMSPAKRYSRQTCNAEIAEPSRQIKTETACKKCFRMRVMPNGWFFRSVYSSIYPLINTTRT